MTLQEYLVTTDGVLAVARLAATLEAGDRAATLNGQNEYGDNGYVGMRENPWHYTDRALSLIIAAGATLERAAQRDDYLVAQRHIHRPPTSEELAEARRRVEAGELED